MKTDVVFCFLLLLVAGGLAFGAGGDMGGSTCDGSADYPLLIEDFNDFQVFCNDTNYWAAGMHIRLDCNLDLDPNLQGRQIYSQAPIAGDTDTDSGFDGTVYAGNFDGNGHVISNLTVNCRYYCGLLGKCDDGSEIKNLGLENANITSSGDYVASLLGSNSGSITGCYSTGNVTGDDDVGSLVGINHASGNITSCYSTGTVIGSGNYVGGLVGDNDGSINSCYSTGAVNGAACVGGLAGTNYGSPITDCYSTGAVNGDDEVGGLVGTNYEGRIISCYSTGAVTSDDYYVGGLVGRNYSGNITSCYSTGKVNGSYEVGGLVGCNDEACITNCYSTGVVNGDGDVGGLVGINDGIIISSFWDVNTSGIGKSNGGIGKTTVEMQTMSTFADAGWDFGDLETAKAGYWYMPADSYPDVYWQDPEVIRSPNIAGLKVQEVQPRLTQAGFTVGQVIYVNSFSIPVSEVAGLSIAQDSYYFNTASAVDIYVSNGSSGDGSSSNPYEVACQADLEAINNDLSMFYVITVDIYMSGVYLGAVIGDSSNSFNGSLDGNGFKISELTIDSDGDFSALIAMLGSSGEVKDLGIENSSVTGTNYYVSSLVGRNSEGSITSCYSTGAVNGHYLVGGLVGENFGGSITSCYSTGVVTCSGSNAGGLVGANCGNITSCYSTGTVNGNGSETVGGLVGSNHHSVTNCYSTGAVNSLGDYVGSLVGKNHYGHNIIRCYSTGAVSGDKYLGGLVGENYGNVIGCYSTGAVSGNKYLGGLVGYLYYDANVTCCFWDTQTSSMTKGVGYGSTTGAEGKTTLEMQTLSTFTNAGWDFIGESINDSNDVWRMCENEVEYPKFAWEFARNGDITCGDGIDLDDLAVLTNNWLIDDQQSNFYGLADINLDGVINLQDFVIIADNWLGGVE